MLVDIRRTVATSIMAKKEYACERCSTSYVAVFWFSHSIDKSMDLFKSEEEDFAALRERLGVEFKELFGRYHPVVSCPQCGAVSREVAAFYRYPGLKRGLAVGCALGLLVGFFGSIFSSSRWWGLAFLIGLAAGGIAGWRFGSRLFRRNARVFTKPAWDELMTKYKWEQRALSAVLSGLKLKSPDAKKPSTAPS